MICILIRFVLFEKIVVNIYWGREMIIFCKFLWVYEFMFILRFKLYYFYSVVWIGIKNNNILDNIFRILWVWYLLCKLLISICFNVVWNMMIVWLWLLFVLNNIFLK